MSSLKHFIGRLISLMLRAALLVVYGVLSTSAGAQPLNITHALSPGSFVTDYALSPDDRYAVYRVSDANAKAELFSVRLSGYSVEKLSGNDVVSGGSVRDFKISPDSKHVVFTGDLRTDGTVELFRAPIQGASGEPTRLHAVNPMFPTGSVRGYDITPDSQRVVYVASLTDATFVELHSVPIVGGASTTLSDNGSGNVKSFKILPDGSRVVFLEGPINPQFSSEHFLRIAPAQGGAWSLINSFTYDSTDADQLPLFGYSISSDSSTLVTSVRSLSEFNDGKLVAFDLSGDAPTALLQGVSFDYRITPDNNYIIYRQNNRLYRERLRGGVRLTLWGDGANESNVLRFYLSPDSSHVVFIGIRSNPDSADLFSVSVAGGAAVKLSSVDTLFTRDAFITPDSTRVVFIEDNPAAINGNDSKILFSVPIMGGASLQLAGFDVSQTQRVLGVSNDSNRVLVSVDDASTSGKAILSIPVLGDSGIAVVGPSSASAVASDGRFSHDSSRVFYINRVTPFAGTLYRTQTGGKSLTLDFDGDDRILASTDILMLMRRRLGESDPAVSAAGTGVNAFFRDAATLASRVDAVLNDRVGNSSPLDIDSNGSIGVGTDMLMMLRYALGLRGTAITQGAIGAPNTFPQRTDPSSIEDHLRYLFTTYEVSGIG